MLYPAALGPADTLFDRVMDAVDWKQEELTLYGRRIAQPRLSAWYGDAAYAYSGLRLEPRPWPPLLAELRDRCAEIAQAPFNSVLANLYRDGADSMDWHSDDEAVAGPRPGDRLGQPGCSPAVSDAAQGQAGRGHLHGTGRWRRPGDVRALSGRLAAPGAQDEETRGATHQPDVSEHRRPRIGGRRISPYPAGTPAGGRSCNPGPCSCAKSRRRRRRRR